MMTKTQKKNILHDVKSCGWSGTHVFPEEGEPGFEYTIGLGKTMGHPEIIIFGLEAGVSHDALWRMVDNMKLGLNYREPGEYTGILKNLRCAIRPVDPAWHDGYFGQGLWYYEHEGDPDGLEAVQVFWPDSQGRFPWEEGCEEESVYLQPLLYEPDDDVDPAEEEVN